MIGLGSNRLSVCRRGGMSVTQAGRGGMEWLAGGRMPSWASPYSAQATAALKDAFTAAQWATIKAYGFAHPEIVPYVNANPTIGLFAATYDGFGDMIINNANDLSAMTFKAPIIAIDAPTDADKMWMMRNGQGYTDWSVMSNIVSQRDWQYVLGGFSSSAVGGKNTYCTLCGTHINNPAAQTFVNFFVPSSMPTGYDAWDADAKTVVVNGTQIFTGTQRSRTHVAYDFSNLIKVNDANYVAITWRASGSFGQDFGFTF